MRAIPPLNATSMRGDDTRSRVASAVLCTLLALSAPAPADVTTDGTVGAALNVPVVSNRYNLPESLGQRMGANLFHSFSLFTVETGRTANFTGSAGISNVIARVTGGAPSQIDGTLQSQVPGADVFLINPQGIAFGPGSRINVPGSLHLSTASYLTLGADGRYDAVDPAASVLSIAPPAAFGFGPAATTTIAFRGRTPPDQVSQALRVPRGERISAIAGNVTLTDRHLYAPEGEIVIVATPANTEVPVAVSELPDLPASSDAEVSIANPGGNFPFVDKPVSNLDVSGDTSGRIVIRGGRVTMTSGLLEASNVALDSTGGIDIAAGDRLMLSGGASIASTSFGAGDGGNVRLSAPAIDMSGGARVDADARGLSSSGSSGNLDVQAQHFSMRDGALISSVTLSEGRAGDIAVAAADFSMQGRTRITSAAIGVLGGAGDGGNIAISSDSFVMADDGTINASSEGNASSTANAGDVDVSSQNIALSQRAFIISDTETAGNAGRVRLRGQRLSLDDEVRISALTTGTGDAGSVEIDVQELNLRGAAVVSSETQSSGDAGSLSATAATLYMTGNSEISARTSGDGRAGRINLTADDLRMESSARIASETSGAGDAGSILVHAGAVRIGDDAALSALSTGTGKGGSIAVATRGSFSMTGGQITSETRGAGDAGAIEVVAEDISLSDGARISAVSSGLGLAGDVHLESATNAEFYGSEITTATENADGGNIVVNAIGRLRLFDSRITTSVAGGLGAGGNIAIDPVFVILQGSDIIANAFGGPGGNIRIVAKHLIKDNQSRIEASSALGIDGIVEIDAPDTDLSSTVAVLGGAYLDVTRLSRQACKLDDPKQNSLVVRNYLKPSLDSLMAPFGEDDPDAAGTDFTSTKIPSACIAAALQ